MQLIQSHNGYSLVSHNGILGIIGLGKFIIDPDNTMLFNDEIEQSYIKLAYNVTVPVAEFCKKHGVSYCLSDGKVIAMDMCNN